MSLFRYGKLIAHSGSELDYKIECDALTDDDIDCLARIYAGPNGTPEGRYFAQVEGIPRGGLRFAEALRRHLDLRSSHAFVLVADDVLTTGRSFEDWRTSHPNETYVHGVTIFARGACPMWITPLITMYRP